MRFALLILLLAGPAQAYNLATSISASCHERLTVEAFNVLIQQVKLLSLGQQVPADSTLRRLLDDLPAALAAEDETVQFAALSLVIGVRAPDTEGHSTLDLNALRRLHADPAPVGQYAHGLRGPDDDGIAGDLVAVQGIRAQVRAELEIARTYFDDGVRVEDRALYLDHYGRFEVPVQVSIYHMGRALHVLQDAHSHTLRTADTAHIVHVLNYVDAVNGTLETGRDGLAHSGALDDCDREELAPIREAVVARSAALMQAAFNYAVRGDTSALELGLAPCPDDATDPRLCGWIEYLPVCEAALDAGDTAVIERDCCTAANRYCDNPWYETALEEPAHPYLGCGNRPGDGGGFVLLLLLLLRRKWLILLGFLVGTAHAAPAAFIATEGHIAPLNDRPDSAVLDLSFGYGVRGGYRLGDWRLVGQIERNHWVATEFAIEVEPGVLNVGLGAEYLFFDDWIRVGMVLGTSTLLYDTQLDEAGATGPYTEIRVGGLRWAVHEHWVITLDPLVLSLLWPVTRDPPLHKVQRRTVGGMEFTW